MSINFRLLRLSRSVYTNINSSRSKHLCGLGNIFLFQLFDLIICDILFISGFCSSSIRSIICLCFCVTSTNGSQFYHSLAAIRFQCNTILLLFYRLFYRAQMKRDEMLLICVLKKVDLFPLMVIFYGKRLLLLVVCCIVSVNKAIFLHLLDSFPFNFVCIMGYGIIWVIQRMVHQKKNNEKCKKGKTEMFIIIVRELVEDKWIIELFWPGALTNETCNFHVFSGEK